MRFPRALLAVVAAAATAVPVSIAVTAHAATSDDPPRVAQSDFYVNPESNAYKWLDRNPGHHDADAIRTHLAEQATANWYGDWVNDIPLSQYVADAESAGRMPIVVAYNMYERDCGGQSQGGADTPDLYRQWIDRFAADLGDRPAIVVLEPDAVAQLLAGCLAEPDVRTELLGYAVDALAATAATVYIDAGNYEWPTDPAQVAATLEDIGVQQVRGFALNTSNHYTTADSVTRAAAINAHLSAPAGFVVDTSRNGSGKTQSGPMSWCNPVGATLGEHSTYSGGPADAHLWLKVPGDSDGDCGYGSGIPAGTFSEKLAMALITGDYV
ncbi:endoglucanase [Stackebrandtia albiflava]|uniref:Glucanase n=1 Tax=Stackebrandtia albiflava TaxID=406432 RepID=A0A562V193_9ACTN|nr:glycoside hydrolase family 6 protein [Stackebrandtia albiflava]TWJ11648.1 endoglucanase [Stackebrandtia albiflava]